MRQFLLRPIPSLLLAMALGAPWGTAMAQSKADSLQVLYLPDNSATVDHAAIIRSFEEMGFAVATYAYAGEDRISYARRITNEVRGLMDKGVDPSNISVLGGGSGSDVALLASAMTGNRYVNFVVLGGCNHFLKKDYHLRLSGNVLALRNDATASEPSCRPLFTGSPRLNARKDLALDAPGGIDLFAGAHEEWTRPAAQWMSSGKVDVGDVKVALAD